MKKVIKVLLIVSILFISYPVFAEDVVPIECIPPQILIDNICTDPVILPSTTVNIHLIVNTNDNLIEVTSCDSDNNPETPENFTPYCAILQSGLQNDWTWYSFGPLLNSLNDIAGFTSKDKDNNDVYHYWSWSLNGVEAMIGLNAYDLQPNDLISLNFIDPTPESEPTPEPEPVVPEPVVSHSGGGSIRRITIAPMEPQPKPTFNLEKALDFLIAQQKEDGSFGEDLYTDWTALALASANYGDQISKLAEYLEKTKTENPSLTDYERHAMALMALGLNPYNINGENYVEKITTQFDGTQFGDANEDNDDIFALIILQNTGYEVSDKIISDDINFILKAQNTDGSWDNSVDMTGAAIEALSVFSLSPDVGESLKKAKDFLKQNQKDNGGWGNASSTAWVIEGILALGEKIDDWKKGENTPLDYLATIQDIDGGIKDLPAGLEEENLQNKIWETAYVASALSGKTWNQIMQKFNKQTIAENPKTKIFASATIKTPEKIIKNSTITNTATATAINATIPIATPTQIEQKETPKKNWFIKLIDNIFSIF